MTEHLACKVSSKEIQSFLYCEQVILVVANCASTDSSTRKIKPILQGSNNNSYVHHFTFSHTVDVANLTNVIGFLVHLWYI